MATGQVFRERMLQKVSNLFGTHALTKQKPPAKPVVMILFAFCLLFLYKVFDEVVNLLIRGAVNIVPLHGIHGAQERFAVDGKVIAVGQGNFARIGGCNFDKVVNVG